MPITQQQKKERKSIAKIGERSQIDICPKKTYKEQLYENMFSISNIRKMPITTTVRYHFILLQTAIIF